MSVDRFALIQTSLQYGWFVAVLVIVVALRRQPWRRRLPLAVLASWAVLVLFVLSYWNFSVDYAPTEEMQADFAGRDGGPSIGAVVFGWLHATIVVGAMEMAFGVGRVLEIAITRLSALVSERA
jgi:hypothetical protein